MRKRIIVVFILIFISFKSISGQIPFYKLLSKAICVDRVIRTEEIIQLDNIDEGNIFGVHQDFISDNKVFILVATNETLNIFTPFDLASLTSIVDKEKGRLVSRGSIIIDKINKRCFHILCLHTTNELEKTLDNIYLRCIRNINWSVLNITEFTVNSNKECKPIMKLNFKIFSSEFPNCKPCNGDFDTIVFYDYEEKSEENRKTLNIYDSCPQNIYNIHNITYDEFLNILSFFKNYKGN